MDRAFADLADDVGNLIRIDAVGGQANGAIDEGLAHGAAGVRLESQARHSPILPQAVGKMAEIRGEGVIRETEEKSVLAFKHGARAVEAVLRQ